MTTTYPFAARVLVGVAGAVVGAVICFGAAVSPVEAHAVGQLRADAAPVARVSYADLDINTAAGRAQLDRRIDRAARQVCASNSASISVIPTQRECIRLAVASATLPARR